MGDLAVIYRRGALPSRRREAMAGVIAERAARLAAERAAVHPVGGWFRAPRRWSVAAALPLLLVAAVAAGTVLSPVVEEALRDGDTTERIVADDLGVSLGVAQTVDGVTVTVERVYADPFQIVIGYRVGGPDGPAREALQTVDTRLTDTSGTVFPHESFQFSTGDTHDETGGNAIFGGGEVRGTPSEIVVRFEVAPFGALNPVYTGRMSGEEPVRVTPATGPRFAFDLAVPFEAGRGAEPGQAVTAAGVTATLERVVTTPLGTRVWIRGAGPNAAVTLTVDGKAYALRAVGYPCPWTVDQTFHYDMTASLLEVSGTWTLDVAASEVPTTGPTAACPQAAGGPWRFAVEVPDS